MAGILTYSVIERLPIGRLNQQYKRFVQNIHEITAAGLLPVFTAFPFNHFP